MPTGVLIHSSLYASTASINSAVLDNKYLLKIPFEMPNLSTGVLSSSGNSGYLTTVVHENKTAVGIVATFSADWYNRIHVSPKSVNVGNLLTTQNRNITLWNAYLEPKTLNSVVESADSGISLDQPFAAPYAMSPLQAAVYGLSVSLQGPPVVSGEYIFDFSAEQVHLVVSGNRIVVWPYMPQHGVTETLEWKTDIIRTKAAEQRIALRDAARQTLEYNFFMDDAQAVRARAISYGWGHRIFGVPVWTDKTHLGYVAAGSSELFFSTADADYREGETLIIWSSATEYEAIGINKVNTGSVELNLPVTNDMHGAEVAPLRYARSKGLELSRGPNKLVKAGVEFWSIADKDSGADVGLPVFGGVGVLNDRMYSISNFDERVIREVNTIDNGIGKIYVDARYSSSDEHFTLSWSFSNRASLWRIKKFVHSLKGRWKTFWLPTNTSDLQLTLDATSSSSVLEVASINYGLYFTTRTIKITRANGLISYHSVTGGATNGGTDSLSLSEPVGINTPVSDVVQICFMYRVRLDSDRLEITYADDGTATLKVPAIEVKA